MWLLRNIKCQNVTVTLFVLKLPWWARRVFQTESSLTLPHILAVCCETEQRKRTCPIGWELELINAKGIFITHCVCCGCVFGSRTTCSHATIAMALQSWCHMHKKREEIDALDPRTKPFPASRMWCHNMTVLAACLRLEKERCLCANYRFWPGCNDWQWNWCCDSRSQETPWFWSRFSSQLSLMSTSSANWSVEIPFSADKGSLVTMFRWLWLSSWMCFSSQTQNECPFRRCHFVSSSGECVCNAFAHAFNPYFAFHTYIAKICCLYQTGG